MKRKSEAPAVVKTSISLPRVLMDFAEERCRLEGYTSLSGYLAQLVREDKQLVELAVEKAVREPEVKYPERRPEDHRMIAEEDKPAKPSSSSEADIRRKARELLKKGFLKGQDGSSSGAAPGAKQ